ncbi:E3 ubiquitin-protein ligase RNF181 homolog [Drosophila pseudoobscura]|uniref:E3 ubiquitin-protein ligase RNF181 homolog n=1 Tax=Drosophila pseudoobscura pseudoobscura TaxID=46245 RepID=A0A6I8UXX3_DROPS|nr:E3 ubiquitin-protein ligase RNF181 homolog [Drosophila pseudoobscura]
MGDSNNDLIDLNEISMDASEENQADAPPLEQSQENKNYQMENAITEIDGINFLLEKEKRNNEILLKKLKTHDQSTQVIIRNLQRKLEEVKNGRDLMLNQLVEKELSYKIDMEELTAILEDPADDITCVICLSPWQSTGAHRVVSLPCGHIFGKSCITLSIRRTKLCPKCRLQVRLPDIRFILPGTP